MQITILLGAFALFVFLSVPIGIAIGIALVIFAFANGRRRFIETPD